jgi:hypothetical protein
VLNDHDPPASLALTSPDLADAHVLLDAFLDSRRRGTTFNRDREVIAWFHAFLQARDPQEDPPPEPGELDFGRLVHAGRATEDGKVAGERITHEISDFFGVWLPTVVDPTAEQWGSAGLVMRLLARWLLRWRLVDEQQSWRVHHFTQRFAPVANGQRRPGYRPAGSTRIWR